MLDPGLILGLCAAVCWGITDVTGALASRVIGSLRVLNGTQITGLAMLSILALAGFASGASVPPVRADWVLVAVVCGVLAMIAYLSFFTALRIGPISIVSPTVAAYGGLTVVLAILFRGERLGGLDAVGAVVATVGVMAVGFVVPEGGRLPRVRGPGVAFALVAMLSFAILSVILAGPIREVGWLPTMLVSRLSNVLLGLLLLAVVLTRRPAILGQFSVVTHEGSRRRAWGFVLLAGLLDTVGLIAFGIGLQVAPVWLVGLASSLGPVVAVGYAVTAMGERPRPIQWAGLVGIITGIVLVGLP